MARVLASPRTASHARRRYCYTWLPETADAPGQQLQRVVSGVAARTGNSYELFGVLWQHRWSGGL